MLKIALIGYGVMGQLIESLSEQVGCTVVAKIDPKLGIDLTEENLKDAEVVIDFALGSSAVDNAKKVCSWGKKIVVGATGFDLEGLKEVKGDIIYGSNFSVGVNLFLKLIRESALIFDKVSEYDVCGIEYHHNRKVDSPSGTAKSVGNVLLENMKRKKRLVVDCLNRKIEPEELHFASVRCGDIPGTHSVCFDSSADFVEIKHSARNRKGFALGALKAAKFIADKQGLFCFEEVFDEILEKQI